MHGSKDFKQCCLKRSPRGIWGNPVVNSPLTQSRQLWLGGRPFPTPLVGIDMDLQNNKQKTGMEGTEGKEKEKGEEWKGDEGNRVEGAAAQPLASTTRGGNRAEGHDPRLPAPSAGNISAGTESVGTGQPIPGPSVGPTEPSAAAVRGPGTAGRKSRSAARPGPRSSKKGLEKGKELTEEEMRSRSNSRNRKGEDDGKESKERRRETGAGSGGSSGLRPADYDTADEFGEDELGPADDTDTVSEASQPSVEEHSAASAQVSTASAPPKLVRGRGRPPTTGQYVGLAVAMREMAEEKERLLGLETEKEVLQSGISRQKKRRRKGLASGGADRHPAASLAR